MHRPKKGQEAKLQSPNSPKEKGEAIGPTPGFQAQISVNPSLTARRIETDSTKVLCVITLNTNMQIWESKWRIHYDYLFVRATMLSLLNTWRWDGPCDSLGLVIWVCVYHRDKLRSYGSIRLGESWSTKGDEPETPIGDWVIQTGTGFLRWIFDSAAHTSWCCRQDLDYNLGAIPLQLPS